VSANGWKTFNPSGSHRVVVTKELPGDRWLDILATADVRVEYGTEARTLFPDEIAAAIGERCDGVIGQLTESWGDELFAALAEAGGSAYSNYAVGYDNVDVAAATRRGIPVGNTPGVLTGATAEMAAALTLAAARRIPEADVFMRSGGYQGWLPTPFLGELLARKTVGVIGAGRIGSAFAQTMVEGFTMHLVYFDIHRNSELEDRVREYSEFLVSRGEEPVTATRAHRVEEVLARADVISLHVLLDETTHHLINRERLGLMKPNAILVNTSRGPVVDEAALVAHCRTNSEFRAALDVFEDEPRMAPGLSALENVVVVPHGGQSRRTRSGFWNLSETTHRRPHRASSMPRNWDCQSSNSCQSFSTTMLDAGYWMINKPGHRLADESRGGRVDPVSRI
jgi:hydroxypyruvate reductase 1